MKKIILTSICILGMAVTANAQLKVNSIGNVIIDSEPTDTSACLYIKSFRTTPSNYFINPTGYQYGLKSQTTGKSKYSMAVYGDATYNTIASVLGNSTCYNCGVYGIAGNSNVNVGVFGGLASNKGAGIYGSSGSSLGSVYGKYAGNFSGDVQVTKALTAKLTNSSDWLFLSNSNPMPSVLDNLEEIDVMRYYVSIPPLSKSGINPGLLEGEHFLLDASSVASVYPCLVGNDDQNHSYVNYTELIPVLLKAIQELKEQVDQLSEQTADGTLLLAPQKILEGNDVETLQTSNFKPQTSKLYQNTPNPFTERTEIRFTLPDDAQNAYIYIFDMQGKMLRQIPVDASIQSVTINGYELSAGIYLYSLAVNGQEIDTKRMILSK